MKVRMAPSAYVWLLLGGVYFMLPLFTTLLFSLKSNQTGSCCTAAKAMIASQWPAKVGS